MGGLYLQASCLTIFEISLEKKINKEIFAFIRITMGFTIKVCVIEKHLLIVGIFTRYEYSMKSNFEKYIFDWNYVIQHAVENLSTTFQTLFRNNYLFTDIGSNYHYWCWLFHQDRDSSFNIFLEYRIPETRLWDSL